MEITTMAAGDLDEALALNTACVPHVNQISRDELQWFSAHATWARVAKIDGKLAGMLIGLRPGTRYKSPNYRWFCNHYDDFAYVDRVAVSEWARRRGVAESLYDCFAASQADVRIMTCEVNLRPPNPGSMRFHLRMGFKQVGSLETNGGEKEVALMEKAL